jgi:hypothetical protein
MGWRSASYTEALALAEQTGEPQLSIPCYERTCLRFTSIQGDRAMAEHYLAKAQAVCDGRAWNPTRFWFCHSSVSTVGFVPGGECQMIRDTCQPRSHSTAFVPASTASPTSRCPPSMELQNNDLAGRINRGQ